MNFSDPLGLFKCPVCQWFKNLLHSYLASRAKAEADLNAQFAKMDRLMGAKPGTARLIVGLATGATGGIEEGGSELVGFRPGRWLDHFMKHGEETGSTNAVEYLRKANALIRGGEGVEAGSRGTDRLFYRGATNELAIVGKSYLLSYFKPISGRTYFLDQIGQ